MKDEEKEEEERKEKRRWRWKKKTIRILQPQNNHRQCASTVIFRIFLHRKWVFEKKPKDVEATIARGEKRETRRGERGGVEENRQKKKKKKTKIRKH